MVAAVAVTAALIGVSTTPVNADFTASPTFAAQENQSTEPVSPDEEELPSDEADDDTTDDPVLEEVPDGFVEVSTIPVVPNVEVEIDGNSGITDEEGKVLIEVEETRGVIERIDVKTRIVGLGDDWEATWQRNYRLGSRRYAMAFSRHMPVSFSFHGSNGEVIERDVIDSMTLKSSLGEVVEDVPLDRPIILHGDRVVSTQRGPEVREIEWSVESLIVRDTNVVNRSQVRFTPSTVDHVDVPLLFFAADFSVHDMFFLSPIVGQIELTLPNGDVELYDLDEEGRLHLDSMPRGEYKVLVLGSGPNIARPVVLSRNQTLDLEFLSWLDITVVGVSLVLFLTVPLIVGRRFLRRRSRRRARAYLEDVNAPETDHGQEVFESAQFEAVVSAAATTDEYGDGDLVAISTTESLEDPMVDVPLEGPLADVPLEGPLADVPLEGPLADEPVGPLADLIAMPGPANGMSPNGVGADHRPDDDTRTAVDAELAALVVLGVLPDDSVGDVNDAGSPFGDEESSADESEPTATVGADPENGLQDQGFTIVNRDESVDTHEAADPEHERWYPPLVLRASTGQAWPEWRRAATRRPANGNDPEHADDDDYSTDSVNR